MSAQDGIKQFWESIPIVSRYLFIGAAAVTLGANFGLFSVYSIAYFPVFIYKDFQV